MDVVRSEINALGGRIETHHGRTRQWPFRMVLPLTTAVTQVVMLRAASFAVGARQSEDRAPHLGPGPGRGLLHRLFLTMVWRKCPSSGRERCWSLRLQQRACRQDRPVVDLPKRLAAPGRMHVDEVLGNQEVVVKNLGPHCPVCLAWQGDVGAGFGAVV